MLQHFKTLSGHQNPVYALANAGEAGLFFSAGNDKGVVAWSLENMAFVKVTMPVQSSVYALNVYQNRLYAGERSGALSVYDGVSQEIVARINAHSKPVFDIRVINGKSELLTVSEDGTAAVWSLNDLSLIYRFTVAASTVRIIAIAPDEKTVAFGCKDHLIKIYNLSDYSPQQTLNGHTLAITALAYHPGGKYLISGSRDAQLKIWDCHSGNLLHNIPAHLFAIYGIAFHPYLPYFATCSQDKSIKLWDAENFKLYKILSLEKTGIGHFHSVNKIIWSPNGKYLISTGDDRQIMVWEML